MAQPTTSKAQIKNIIRKIKTKKGKKESKHETTSKK